MSLAAARWNLGPQRNEASELPLYGSEQVSTWNRDDLIVVVEGEKARDALDHANYFYALGTVCGATVTPGVEALEVLRGRRVCLWPDNDKPGREHMERMAEALNGVATEILIYTWDEAPEKGDAADHPAIRRGDRKACDRLLTDLESAPRWEPTKPRSLQGRVLLGQGIAGELEPPDELEPGILLRGKVHSLYAGPGTGKTMCAQYLVNRCVDRDQAVAMTWRTGPALSPKGTGHSGPARRKPTS